MRSPPLISDVLVPIVTGISGLVSGLILASWRAGLGLASRYDVDLREKRLEAYNKLWSSLKGLDLRARPASMTADEVRALLSGLTAWYHESGGLLMSRTTQRKFAKLQLALIDLRAGRSGRRSGGRRWCVEPDHQLGKRAAHQYDRRYLEPARPAARVAHEAEGDRNLDRVFPRLDRNLRKPPDPRPTDVRVDAVFRSANVDLCDE